MPRDLPLGNGSLLLNFDKSYNLRDIYWPHVGQELHTAGDISHTGVWVEGQFAWLDAPEWQREMLYAEETLVTRDALSCWTAIASGLSRLCRLCAPDFSASD